MENDENQWDIELNSLKEQLIEFSKLQNTLYQYYRGQFPLESFILYIKSKKITEPENRHQFIDFCNIMINCERNDQLFLALKDDFQRNFTKVELFSIFAQRKKILHSLFNNGFISPHTIQLNMNDIIFKNFYFDLKNKVPDSYLEKYITKNHLEKYFTSYNENKESKKQTFSKKKLKDIIKNDNLDEFIDFVNKTELKIDGQIPNSSFDYDFRFKKNPPTFVEYAAKMGSLNIFKYLISSKVSVPKNVREEAIYGGNTEIIHIVEDLNISFDINCLSVAIESRNIPVYEYLKNSIGLVNGIDQLKTSIKSFNIYVLIDIINERADLFKNYDSFIEILTATCSCGFLLLFDFLYNKIVPLFTNPRFDINFKYLNDVFYFKIFNETILFICSNLYKIEIIKIILQNPEIDINSPNINGILNAHLF